MTHQFVVLAIFRRSMYSKGFPSSSVLEEQSAVFCSSYGGMLLCHFLVYLADFHFPEISRISIYSPHRGISLQFLAGLLHSPLTYYWWDGHAIVMIWWFPLYAIFFLLSAISSRYRKYVLQISQWYFLREKKLKKVVNGNCWLTYNEIEKNQQKQMAI